jgi:tRNA(Ile)-lysidine synthase
MLLRTVRATIEKYGMLSRGDFVIVAVSGGPDSIALLHVLNSLRSVYGIKLHAAHLEHGLRGEESLEDMRFVEVLCKGLSIPITIGRENVSQIASSSKLSVEAAARTARYAFLKAVMNETGAGKIATGHNANDQAETLLLNLVRGSGITGLSGIRPAIEETVVRPLIEAKRDEILSYLENKGITYRTDSSNLDDRFDRNRIRNVLLPLVEKEFNPRIVDSLVRTASVFSYVNEYLAGIVKETLGACCATRDGRATIDLEVFKGVPQAIRLFSLYSVLRSLEGDEQVVSFDTISAVLNLAMRSKSGSRVDIGSGIVALREFDRLVIGRDLARPDTYEVQVSIPGSVRVDQADCTFVVDVLNERPDTPDIYRSGETAYFDFGELEFPLVVRSWREGDRFVPFGLSGSKKVHDVFVDEKVPISQRSRTPIICDREGVIWIAGIRRADRARVTDKTKTIMKITCKKD